MSVALDEAGFDFGTAEPEPEMPASRSVLQHQHDLLVTKHRMAGAEIGEMIRRRVIDHEEAARAMQEHAALGEKIEATRVRLGLEPYPEERP